MHSLNTGAQHTDLSFLTVPVPRESMKHEMLNEHLNFQIILRQNMKLFQIAAGEQNSL
jgi:hypothetical protein